MKNLAVIFPGIGYHKDKPLLYYAGRLAAENGYEVVRLSFSDIAWEPGDFGNHKKVLEHLNTALHIAETHLAEAARDIKEYDRIVFFSKSLGTVVAAAYAAKHSLEVAQIYFTPLEAFGSFAQEGNGIAFYGTEDPYADAERIAGLLAEKKIDGHRIEGADHSLETPDTLRNIGILQEVMEVVADVTAERGLYRMSVPARDGSLVHLSDYRGKILLIVNTATGCGFTPQYEGLESLYRKFRPYGFEVLDFPCNQFANQAPGSSSEIHSFCKARYDISFEQFGKTIVNGENELELYTYLKSKQGFRGFAGTSPNSVYLEKKVSADDPDYRSNSKIKWNFTKFLIGRDGEVLARFEPDVEPEVIEKEIEELLS